MENLKVVLYENKQIVKEFIKNELPLIKLVESDATYLLWLDCSQLNVHSKILCEFLKSNQGLFLSPGHEFGDCGKNFMRMNIACPKELLIKGLHKLKGGIINYQRFNPL